MSDAETRALGRAAALLLVASVVRWGWAATRGGPVGPVGDDALPGLIEESREAVADAEERARPLGKGERLDPNRASEAQLDRLPGVGPATARAIVASRTEEGPFTSAEELTRVRGVGPALLDRMRGSLDLSRAPPASLGAAHGVARRSGVAAPAQTEGPKPASEEAPVDVNRADEAALETLPGIGPALARRIVEARRERAFRSVEDLTRVRGIGPATVARLGGRVTVGR
jgi:competence ComEA-like helix-hairpin-helix protein